MFSGDKLDFAERSYVKMKHKTLWVFITWILLISIFELPLTWDSVENNLMKSIIDGYGSVVFIVICDLYIIASLIALVIAKSIIKTVDDIKNNLIN